MNPSQNDSFGSFSNGQGGFGGYSTGGQIFSPAPGAVSSGGDIVVGGRKSRKWLVVLIVVLLFAAVAGGVFAVWKSGIISGGGNTTNRFVNYLLYDIDSSGEVSLDCQNNISCPFDQMLIDPNEEYVAERLDKAEKLLGEVKNDSDIVNEINEKLVILISYINNDLPSGDIKDMQLLYEDFINRAMDADTEEDRQLYFGLANDASKQIFREIGLIKKQIKILCYELLQEES